MLNEIAEAVWLKLGINERANAATTIAVVKCADGKMYCTSNDVSQISEEASALAKAKGISPIGKDFISRSGAGFHAEMWMVIQALHQDGVVSKVLKGVGASRPCCKGCTDVLKVLDVPMETPSDTEYKSWYNPMTVGEDCRPRKDFASKQLKHIPDFRNNSTSYWFTPGAAKDAFQKTPPESAK
jgi:hypothetical protein